MKPSNALLNDLLKPIPGKNPCGEWLKYGEAYDLIQLARVEENENLPQGVWEHDLKEADWKQVEEVSLKALKSKTKDLQVAAWLSESWLQLNGVGGFNQGLQLITNLVTTFWDGLYPELNDIDFRMSPILWMNEKLNSRFLLLPLSVSADVKESPIFFHDWVKLQKKPSDPLKNRMEKGIQQTGRVFYEDLHKGAIQMGDLLESLDKLLLSKTKQADGALYKLKDISGELVRFADFSLKFHPKESPVEPKVDPTQPSADKKESPMSQFQAPVPSGPISSREEAYAALEQVAQFLEQREPHSPTPYLIRRAVSWGHMTLAELIQEFSTDPSGLNQLTRLLGLDQAKPAAPQQPNQSPPPHSDG